MPLHNSNHLKPLKTSKQLLITLDDYFLSGAYQVLKYAAKWSLLVLRGLKEENFNMMNF